MSCDLSECRNSKSALHRAAQKGDAQLLQDLLSTRVDPNSVDDAGNTPLHFAADVGHENAVHALLKAGASRDARNNFGRKVGPTLESWDTPELQVRKQRVQAALGLPLSPLVPYTAPIVRTPAPAMPTPTPPPVVEVSWAPAAAPRRRLTPPRTPRNHPSEAWVL